MNENTKPETFKVKLLKDGHTHKGQPRAKGETIEVTAGQKKFLQSQSLIAGDDASKPAKS